MTEVVGESAVESPPFPPAVDGKDAMMGHKFVNGLCLVLSWSARVVVVWDLWRVTSSGLGLPAVPLGGVVALLVLVGVARMTSQPAVDDRSVVDRSTAELGVVIASGVLWGVARLGLLVWGW